MSLCPVPAGAQESSRAAAAEGLFRAGRELIAERRYREACEKLDASQKLDPAVGTQLSLGECYAGQGRTASAWLAYRGAFATATARRDPRMAVAEQRAIAIEPQLATVTVRFDGPAVTRMRVAIGGEAFEPEVLTAPIPIDPGSFEVTVRAPGYRTWSATYSASPGGTTLVTVPPLAPEPKLAALDAAPVPGATRRAVGLGIGALGIATAGVGAIFGMQAIVKIRDANGACPANACRDDAAVQESRQGHTFADVSNVLLPVGLVVLGAGAIVYLTAPGGLAPTMGVDLRPGGASFDVGASW